MTKPENRQCFLCTHAEECYEKTPATKCMRYTDAWYDHAEWRLAVETIDFLVDEIIDYAGEAGELAEQLKTRLGLSGMETLGLDWMLDLINEEVD